MAGEKFSYKLITFLSGFDGVTAYAIILGVLFACGMGIPIPEDITLLAAGILAALGKISFEGALIAGFVGVMIGDCLLFFMGRKFGYRVFELPGFRTVFTESRIAMAREKVLSNSKFICFIARFMPGLRSPIFLTAGILGVHPLIFLGLDGFAALISVPVWVWLGFYLGENIDTALDKAADFQGIVIVLVLLVIGGYVAFIKFNRPKKIQTEIESSPSSRIPPTE